jgi:hypothetical protein
MREQCSAREPDAVPQAQLQLMACEPQREQAHQLQDADDETVRIAEQDRAGVDPEFAVVLAVRHGVHRVVGHRPQQAREEQHPREPRRYRSGVRGESHRHRPRERDAQIELRDWEEALHERIGDHEPRADERHQLREAIQRHRESEGDQPQSRAQRQRFHRIDLARDQRAVARACDVAVEVAIREIVHRAAGRARQDDAEDEHDEDVWIGPPLGREP